MIKVDVFVRKSLQTPDGRHKLYHSCRWPWITRANFYNPRVLDEEAFQQRLRNGDNTPFVKLAWPRDKYEFLPEDEFWATVYSHARKNRIRRARAFSELLGAPFDPQSDPPHPLCRTRQGESQ